MFKLAFATLALFATATVGQLSSSSVVHPSSLPGSSVSYSTVQVRGPATGPYGGSTGNVQSLQQLQQVANTQQLVQQEQQQRRLIEQQQQELSAQQRQQQLAVQQQLAAQQQQLIGQQQEQQQQLLQQQQRYQPIRNDQQLVLEQQLLNGRLNNGVVGVERLVQLNRPQTLVGVNGVWNQQQRQPVSTVSHTQQTESHGPQHSSSTYLSTAQAQYRNAQLVAAQQQQQQQQEQQQQDQQQQNINVLSNQQRWV